MMNTIERTLSQANESVTGRLDELENSLPEIPSKALAATRASVRRVNDVVGSATRGAKETAGQARTTSVKSVETIRRGAAETAGQVRAQTSRTVEAVNENVGAALDDAEVAVDPDDIATLTKAELYERAQKLDIDGRSGMTKAELIGALQKS